LRVYRYKKSPFKVKNWMALLAEDSLHYDQLKKYSDLWVDHIDFFKQVREEDTYWMGIKACGKKNDFEFWGGTHADPSGHKLAEDYFLGKLTVDGEQKDVVLWASYFARKNGARVGQMAYCPIGKKKFVTMDVSEKVTFVPMNRLSPDYAKSAGITLKK